MNSLDIFQKEAPEVAKAFDGLIEALKASTGFDSKTKQLDKKKYSNRLWDNCEGYWKSGTDKKKFKISYTCSQQESGVLIC